MTQPQGSQARRVTFALDQNFPQPILQQVRGFIPQADMLSISEIDAALARVEDCELVSALGRRGFSAVVTNDYHMLRQPGVLLAAQRRQVSIVAIEALGHDSVRATGAFLLDLPAIAKRIAASAKPMIFRIGHTSPTPHSISVEFENWARAASKKPKDLIREDQKYLKAKGLW